jgi:hypothetical protein
LQQETTTDGKKVVFTNDVSQLTKIDKNYQEMINQLTKDVKISEQEITSIKSTQTSTGNTYSIIVKQGNENNQVDVIYNQDTQIVKIVDM